MSAPVETSGADRVAEIEVALDALLKAVMAAEAERRENRSPIFEFLTIADIKAEDLPTRAESEMARLIEKPVETACRAGIRKLGQEIFRISRSTETMGQVLERVAELDPPNWGTRMSIVDACLDMVGEGQNLWLR